MTDKPTNEQQIRVLELLIPQGYFDLRSVALVLEEYAEKGNLGKAISLEMKRLHEMRFNKDTAFNGKPIC